MTDNASQQSHNPRLQADGASKPPAHATGGAHNPRLQANAAEAAEPVAATSPAAEVESAAMPMDAMPEQAAASATVAAAAAPAGSNNPRLHTQSNAAAQLGHIGPAQQSAFKPIDTQYSQRSYRSYAQQRRENQPGNAADGSVTHNPQTAEFYNTERYTAKKEKKPISKVAIVVSVLAAVAVGVGVWFYFNPLFFSVYVNGTQRQAFAGTTIQQLINEGAANPAPGDLLAVDGTLLQAGNGDAFEATINGTSTTDGEWEVHKNDVIEILDGKDTTETATTTTTTVEPQKTVTGSGAIHLYTAGQPGMTVQKVGDISGLTVTEVQSEVVNGGVAYYNADTGGDKVIALTFDDGPWAETTSQILSILAANNAKATFFTIGNQVADFAPIVKQAADAGHQICTHSWDHAEGSGQGVNLTYMTPEEQVAEIQRGMDAVANATGKPASTVIRSPGGNFYGDLIWTLEPLISAEINWDIDTEDWKRPGVEAIANQILSAGPGSIVLMHDGGGDRSQTVQALQIALPKLVSWGYRFVTIDELIELAANTPAGATAEKATTPAATANATAPDAAAAGAAAVVPETP